MDDVTTTSDESPVEDAQPTEPMTTLDPIDGALSLSGSEPGPGAEPETVAEPEPEPALELSEAPGSESAAVAAGSGAQPSLDDLIADLAVEGEPADGEAGTAEDGAGLAEGDASDAPTRIEAEEARASEPQTAPVPVAPVAPTASPIAADPAAEAGPMLERLWTHVPFWVIAGAWVVLTAAMTALLWNASAGGMSTGIPYAVLVLGGGALVVIGLVAGLVISLLVRGRTVPGERAGLFLAVWNRALLWTAGGVLVWWIGLLLLDLHHVAGIG
jgi:hypothetical protein